MTPGSEKSQHQQLNDLQRELSQLLDDVVRQTQVSDARRDDQKSRLGAYQNVPLDFTGRPSRENVLELVRIAVPNKFRSFVGQEQRWEELLGNVVDALLVNEYAYERICQIFRQLKETDHDGGNR